MVVVREQLLVCNPARLELPPSMGNWYVLPRWLVYQDLGHNFCWAIWFPTLNPTHRQKRALPTVASRIAVISWSRTTHS